MKIIIYSPYLPIFDHIEKHLPPDYWIFRPTAESFLLIGKPGSITQVVYPFNEIHIENGVVTIKQGQD